jgi:hypothetical protein
MLEFLFDDNLRDILLEDEREVELVVVACMVDIVDLMFQCGVKVFLWE